jgi:hypothetical protein
MIRDDVELLDLCTLAYQLHAQTLLCAPDPYGEQMMQATAGGARRYRFLDANAEILNNPPPARAQEYTGIKGYPGPAAGGGHVTLAPIPAKYDRISPNFPGFVRPDRDSGTERWIKYATPAGTTSRIGHWQTFAYPTNAGPAAGAAAIPFASTLNPAQPPLGSPDRLYCFEGATGLTPQTPGVWSLMGFVLARTRPNRPQNPPIPYDLVVSFRGSRSGHISLPRIDALMRAGIDPNPDWKTNLDEEFVNDTEIGVGRVHRGFASATKTMFPTIRACVDQAHQDMGGPPIKVNVIGHSLGGALATCFASAVRLGISAYLGQTPVQQDLNLQAAWQNLIVVTFGAPGVGGHPRLRSGTFARAFNNSVTHRAYRIRGDVIPRDAEGERTGIDIILPGNEQFGSAHNPENIRRHLEEYLEEALLRTRDNLNPWSEGNQIQDVLPELQQLVQTHPPGNRPAGTQLPFRFRDGLVVYLSAFAKMKSRDMGADRLLSNQMQHIDYFLDRVCPVANVRHTDDVDWVNPDQNGLPQHLDMNFTSLASIHQIAKQDGMLRMLKHWLALMTVQNGGAIQQQQARTWFEL